MTEFFETNLHKESSTRIESIQSETFEDLSVKFCTMFSEKAKAKAYGANFGSCSQAEFNFNILNSTETKFCQIRKIAQYFTITFPTIVMREKLRNLLTDDARNVFDSIINLSQALDAVNSFGPFYMSSCTLGALLTATSTSTSSTYSTSSDLLAGLSAEIDYEEIGSVKSERKITTGVNVGKKNKEITFNVSALGGEPTYILTGKENDWLLSAQNNLAIVNASFSPISYLAKAGSKAEDLLTQAVELYSASNETLYYYWRQYGNNYPILYKCSQLDYAKYKDRYNGTGVGGKSARDWKGIYLNYNVHFISTHMSLPSLSYCADTYYYYYGQTTYGEMTEKIGDPELTPMMLKKYLES